MGFLPGVAEMWYNRPGRPGVQASRLHHKAITGFDRQNLSEKPTLMSRKGEARTREAFRFPTVSDSVATGCVPHDR